MLKYYVVTAPSYHFDNIFVAKANNKKEAIKIVFLKHFAWQNTEELKAKGYAPYLQKDLQAEELEKLFSESLDNDKQYISLDYAI